MKNLFSAAVLLLLAALFITSASAQKPKSKEETLNEIATLSKTTKPEDMAKAYEVAKDFLVRFGKDKDKDGNIAKVRDFVNGYREDKFFKAIDGKKYADAFTVGKEILAEQPNDVAVMMSLAYAGYNISATPEGKAYLDDAISYARKSTGLVEAGTEPKSYAPFKDKNEAMAFMYFIDGSLTLSKDMKAAAASLYKATQIEASIKNSSLPYYLIATYYEDLYGKMSADLKAKSKTLSDADFKAESDKVDKVVEAMMDAYARAVKRAEAESSPNKTVWKNRLTQVYTFKNKSAAALPEYINYANTMPMPDPGKF